MELAEFEKNFGDREISKELIWLHAFQNHLPEYAQSFYLLVDNKSGLKTWSTDDEFLNNLMPFAAANGSGSFYALWDDGTGKSLSDMPVIVFGDEGGVHVAAENVLQLMQLLTYDTEISVDHEEAYFYKNEEDFEPSEDSEAYRNWLKEHFQLDVIDETETIIQSAQDKYKADFDKWFANFYNEA